MSIVVRTAGSSEDFNCAIKILIEKPNVVNKRLAGADIVHMGSLANNEKPLKDLDQGQKFDLNNDDMTRNLFIVRKNVFKANFQSKSSYESINWKSDNAEATFADEDGEYTITFDKNYITVDTIKTCEDKKKEWLENTVLAKVKKWCDSEISKHSNPGSTGRALQLVDLQEYEQLYNDLKTKYFNEIKDHWHESTDPGKFIHEDLGIAAYLMLIWKSQPRGRFLDVGCGNGLLVYILTKEGFHGSGFDLRSRKIWTYFQSQGCILDVRTLSPDPGCLDEFKGCAWIIGNHSDELTPWMPLYSFKSNAKLFLLPCCPFKFYGKFDRKEDKSVYREFLDYVKDVGEKVGIVMEEDKLRIPSTKRICFIGRKSNGLAKNQAEENMAKMLEIGHKFSARSSEEKVRNCTSLSKDQVIDPVIKLVVDHLLKCDEKWPEESEAKVLVDTNNIAVREWNAGGKIPLHDLVKIVPGHLLSAMKNECGGLQTLLRNNNHLFVVERGCVRLRCPIYDTASSGKRKRSSNNLSGKRIKTKMCWFYENHPQSCPVKSELCDWAHGQEDIKS